MINFEHPERLIIISFFMLLFGCITPFLMVIEVIESTLFMNFLSFTISTLGLFLGITGTALYGKAQKKRKKNDEDENYYDK